MSTKPVFYIYEGPSDEAYITLASLIALIMPRPLLYIHTNDKHHATIIQEHLWAYPENRFLPSSLSNSTPDGAIHIGYEDIPKHRQFIINASNQQLHKPHIPDIEWVSEDKAHARDRYRYWLKNGHTMTVHKIHSNQDLQL